MRDLLKKVLFIGGSDVYASVKVRTIQIAIFLGCDFVANESMLTPEMLVGKELFILTKAFHTFYFGN